MPAISSLRRWRERRTERRIISFHSQFDIRCTDRRQRQTSARFTDCLLHSPGILVTTLDISGSHAFLADVCVSCLLLVFRAASRFDDFLLIINRRMVAYHQVGIMGRRVFCFIISAISRCKIGDSSRYYVTCKKSMALCWLQRWPYLAESGRNRPCSSLAFIISRYINSIIENICFKAYLNGAKMLLRRISRLFHLV